MMGEHFVAEERKTRRWIAFCTRTARFAKVASEKKFLSEFIAESVWRSLDRVCEKCANAFFGLPATYFRMEEYLLVQIHASLQCDGGLRQSQDGSTSGSSMIVVWLCVG